MANYGVKMSKAITSVTEGVGAIYAPAAAMRRVRIYDLLFGSSAAADGQFVFDVQRITTAPTSTLVVPDPLDPADPACVTLAGENVTVNGTLTAGVVLLSVPLNQRSTVRWACRDGKELVIPATASNGVQIQTPTAVNTPAAVVTAQIEEL